MSVKKLTRIALMAALLVVCKECLSFIPNGEVVTSIVTVGTLVFGAEMILTTLVFTLLETLIYGWSLWVVMYVLVWPTWVLIVLLLRKYIHNKYVWMVIEGLYGVCFGTLCSIPYWFIGGPSMALTWIASGFTFDLMHGFFNLIFGYLTYDVFERVFTLSKRELIYN